nr:dihydropteroate synthase [Moraxella caviae]
MGVLNVTPDSFSDGGRFDTVENALRHCEEMLNYGADIIDIGGESTRPNAAIVSTDTELERVVPVISAVRQNFGNDVWLSIDTSNPAVMQAAINAGADIINDVRGLRKDGAAQVAAALDCPVIIMHSRGEPTTMNSLARYTDVISEVKSELQTAITAAKSAGVRHENIIIDMGMGFAKDHVHHQKLLANLHEFITHFDLPMLFGVSRKRFLGECLNAMSLEYLNNHTAQDRDNIGTLAHIFALQQGASIVRVHDVKPMVQAAKFWQMMSAFDR